MSRYANRFSSSGGPPPSSGYHRSEDYFLGDEGRGGYGGGRGGGGMRGGYAEEDGGDEDDDTAVATDLSGLNHQQPRRGVSFGQNEVEEFNGSEAPEAIIPARSNSRMGHRPSPVPQQQQQQQRASPAYGGIGRPRSTSMDGRRLPPPPQPPTYDSRYGGRPSPASFDRERDRGYGRQPVSFARGGYDDDDGDVALDGASDDDDDDAFTAVATGVATELDLDDDDQRRRQQLIQQQRYGYPAADPRDRYQQQQQSSAMPIQRPPSRGVQVYRQSPIPPPSLPPPPPALPPALSRFANTAGGPRTASGYQASDFSSSADGGGDDDLMPPPPLPSSRRNSPSVGGGGNGYLSPPTPQGRALARPASTGSMRMLIDEDGEGGLPGYGREGIGRQQTPRTVMRDQQARQAQAQAEQVASLRQQQQQEEEEGSEDSPVEKELIALLKELRFSIALKDFHDTMRIGVQKTLVAEDGMGHAYCKIHCKKLPRHDAIDKEDHLKQHWIPIAGSRWEFRTASHRVTVVFKTAQLAAYEAQFLTGKGGRR